MDEFIEIRNSINKSWGQHHIDLKTISGKLVLNYMFNWGTIIGKVEIKSEKEVLKTTKELLEKYGIKKRRFSWDKR